MQAVGLPLARWLFFASAMAAFGTALFPLYGVRPLDRHHFSAAWSRLIILSASLALLSTLAWLSLIVVDIAGDDPGGLAATARTLLVETEFGPVMLVRLVAACALLAAATYALAPFAVLGLAATVLGSEAWTGHAATAGPGRQADILVHVLAAGAWFGGLIPLAHVVLRSIADGAFSEIGCRALRRFSGVGMVSVGLIAATGVTGAWSISGSFPASGGAYDRAVVAKVFLFIIILMIAAFNRFRLLPPLTKASDEERRRGLRLLERTILVELGLGLAVLFAASILGLSEPFA
jgi:putative copper resistance protein D